MNSRTTNEEQFQMLLKIEHIRQHLIDVGLIDRQGEVIPTENPERSNDGRSRTVVSAKATVQNRKDPKQHRSLKPLNQRRLRSASKQRNKSQASTRPSSPHQPTPINTLDRHRIIRPKRNQSNDRCLVTMIYHGSQPTANTKRNRSDEIIIMQQHCGGRSIPVYRGTLKCNETFQFQSRRHFEYPFALAFYVNGLIDNRLSICCEYRYQYNVRISGKGGLFGIVHVQKCKACSRCRDEQRRNKSIIKNTPNQLSSGAYSSNMAEDEQNLSTSSSSVV